RGREPARFGEQGLTVIRGGDLDERPLLERLAEEVRDAVLRDDHRTSARGMTTASLPPSCGRIADEPSGCVEVRHTIALPPRERLRCPFQTLVTSSKRSFNHSQSASARSRLEKCASRAVAVATLDRWRSATWYTC